VFYTKEEVVESKLFSWTWDGRKVIPPIHLTQAHGEGQSWAAEGCSIRGLLQGLDKVGAREIAEF
jgi:hypothetical protein